jgi:hypothetical protein
VVVFGVQEGPHDNSSHQDTYKCMTGTTPHTVRVLILTRYYPCISNSQQTHACACPFHHEGIIPLHLINVVKKSKREFQSEAGKKKPNHVRQEGSSSHPHPTCHMCSNSHKYQYM